MEESTSEVPFYNPSPIIEAYYCLHNIRIQCINQVGPLIIYQLNSRIKQTYYFDPSYQRQQIFIVKMDFTVNRPSRAYQTDTKSNHRKYSINAASPRDNFPLYDSPSLHKPLTFARTSDKEYVGSRGGNDPSLQRSPIDPLVASRESAFQGFSVGEVEQMRLEHRVEIETLMLEINNLRNLLYESSELQVQELQRLKQGYQENNFLQMSTFRQNQNSQVEAYQLQVRKLKEQLAEKGQKYKKLEVQLSRERKSHDLEKETLKEQVRILIEKKNGEIYELKQEQDQKLRKLESQKEQEIQEIKYNSNKELSSISKSLESKSRQLERLVNASTAGQQQREGLLERLQSQKDDIQKRYEKRIAQQYEKYENLKTNFNKLIFQTTQIQENNWRQLQAMFNSQYSKIFELVRHKDQEVVELKRQVELEQHLIKAQKEATERQSQLLKQRLKDQADNFQKEIELLKVKIALLHQTDLEKVKELYELRLKNSLQDNSRLEEENAKLREMMQISSNQRYEMKQRHDITVSELNAKILKMRMGIHSLESDFKEKLENEKSLMLMTSRSFLKEAQVKNNNNKFLEEEIRKLRQLMDLQTRENQSAERAVQEKILAANNELERLTSRVLIIAQEKKELEEGMDTLRSEKDKEIARLKAQIASFEIPKYTNQEQLKIIEQLKEEKDKYLEEMGILKDKIASLEHRMKEMKAEIERANMQANINHEEGRRQYHQIAESHLSQFKKFYEGKLKRVQDQKQELKKIINSQYEQITELIKKYKSLEESMKDAVTLMKKRTVLEEKVMNLGMDNNLIKNLSQLLPGYHQA